MPVNMDFVPEEEETVVDNNNIDDSDWLDGFIKGEPDEKYVQGKEESEEEGEEDDDNSKSEETDTEEESDENESDENEDEEEDDEDDSDEKEKVEEDKSSAAFARMRKENAQMKHAIKQLAKATGMTEEEALKKLETDALNARAKNENLSPEALRRLEDAENKAKQAEYKLQLQSTERKLMALESDLGLEVDEVKEFVREMQEDEGINVLETDIDFSAYYVGKNFDALAEVIYDRARQDVLAEMETADKAPGATNLKGSGGGGSNSDKVIKSVDDLNSMLDGLTKK